MSIENPIDKFDETVDTNRNGKLEKTEIENWTWIELSSLKENIINEKLNKLAPNYEKDFKNISIEEKKGYLIIFSYARKILWKNFYIEFLKKGWEYPDIPLDEMTSFISENLLNEQNKESLQTKEIILTTDELKELHEILIKKEKKKQLKFIKEQLNEDKTSAEIIQWTSFANKIESLWKNPTEFMKNIDTVWFTYLKSNLPNISKDVLRNMATWMTFTFIRLFEERKWKVPQFLKDIKKPQKILKHIKNYEWKPFLIKTNLLINAIKEAENDKNWEKNVILMDPQKFSKLYYNILTWNINTEGIIEQNLENASWKYEAKNRETDELKDIANNANKYITKENLEKAWWIAWLGEMINNIKRWIESIKQKGKKEILEHASSILKFKDSLQSIWVFKYIKKFFNEILKLLWFRNGWNEFEKKAENKDFQKITEYFKNLKNKLTPDFLKTENWKKSIFSAWFEKNLNWNKKNNITKIKVKWKLSYESFKYLHKIWWNHIEKNLNNFFTSKKFDTLFENDTKSKDDFYKKAFTIEKDTKNWKPWKKITINILVVDFDEIDKVIQKDNKKEEGKDKKKSITTTNITDIYAVNIKNLDSIKITEKDRKLLDFIWQYESWNNYNAIYWNSWQNKTKFTQITIAQVIKNREHWSPSSAVWKYQFLAKTLKDLIKRYKIDPTTKFTSEIQDKLAILKAKERWWDKFLKWEISQTQFINNLSKEWAFIPKDASWLSFYNKDWLNRALISYNNINSTLDSIKTA